MYNKLHVTTIGYRHGVGMRNEFSFAQCGADRHRQATRPIILDRVAKWPTWRHGISLNVAQSTRGQSDSPFTMWHAISVAN